MRLHNPSGLLARAVVASILAVTVTHPTVAQPIAADQLEARMVIAGGDDVRAPSIPIVEERLSVAIDGQHATSTLIQVFQHDNGSPIEGRYRLRPGSGSQVEGFAYWNGEHKIVGEVFERGAANQVYDRVTSRRRDPGLLEQAGEGAFAFKVFPIQPRERKRVELHWTKWLERRGRAVRYRAPITRGDAAIAVEIAGPVRNVRSPSHRIHIERTVTGVRLRSDGASTGSSGGELVVDWDSDGPEWEPSVFVHGADPTHEGYFAMALATGDIETAAIADKDVTIVIDRSGSMNGEPIAQARAAAIDMIRRLAPTDRVNVVSFSDEVDPLFQTPQSVRDERERATRFVDQLNAGGGTDIALALATAIRSMGHAASRGERPGVIVFITDGQSDVAAALAAASADTADVRLFTVGLGKDVNRPLLQRLAALKRGNFTYIERTSDIQRDVARLATHIAKPLLVGVTVEVEGAHAVRLYPRSLPDLFVDDELLVTGRVRGSGKAKFIIKGRLAGKPVALSRIVDLAAAPPRRWVGRLWAQSRVQHLLEEIALGQHDPELPKEVLDLALTYNFITPYTAFLAIPESELGGERQTLEQMRAYKNKVKAEHSDASDMGGEAQPAPSPGRVAAGVDAERADDSEVLTVNARRGRGCAGCATTGSGGQLALAAMVVIITLRRRRRATTGRT